MPKGVSTSCSVGSPQKVAIVLLGNLAGVRGVISTIADLVPHSVEACTWYSVVTEGDA